MQARPQPPDGVGQDDDPKFLPAPEIVTWARATFIDPDGPLYNEEHGHLEAALIGALWTNKANARQMRTVLGQAEMPSTMGDAWKRGRFEQQLVEWFGFEPHFVITIFAPAAAEMDDDQFCALVEHELLHCGCAKDLDGLPRFNKDGNPIFAMRGHDIEQFVSIVRRYGPAAAGVEKMIEAANAPRTVTPAFTGWACGTCGRP